MQSDESAARQESSGEPIQFPTDEEVEEWFRNLPPVPPKEEEGLDRIINDAFQKAFDRPLNIENRE